MSPFENNKNNIVKEMMLVTVCMIKNWCFVKKQQCSNMMHWYMLLKGQGDKVHMFIDNNNIETFF